MSARSWGLAVRWPAVVLPVGSLALMRRAFRVRDRLARCLSERSGRFSFSQSMMVMESVR